MTRPFTVYLDRPDTIAGRLNVGQGISLGARAVALAEILCACGFRVQVDGGEGTPSLPFAVLRDLDGVALNRAYAETHDEAVVIVFQVWKCFAEKTA